MSAEQTDVARMRIDKFLFFTRFFKTRSLAGRAIAEKGARITRNDQTRRVDKASATVETGDILSFSCGRDVVVLTVLDIPERRGPAPEARTFYNLLENDA